MPLGFVNALAKNEITETVILNVWDYCFIVLKRISKVDDKMKNGDSKKKFSVNVFILGMLHEGKGIVQIWKPNKIHSSENSESRQVIMDVGLNIVRMTSLWRIYCKRLEKKYYLCISKVLKQLSDIV